MTVAFANPADRSIWIKNHALSKQLHFLCYGVRYIYHLLDDPDTDMSAWVGYCANDEAFYVSNIGTKALREQLLTTECRRLFYSTDKSHMNSVQTTLRDPNVKGKVRENLISAFLRFYQEYADKFVALNEHTLTDEQRDIIATAQFLKNLKG